MPYQVIRDPTRDLQQRMMIFELMQKNLHRNPTPYEDELQAEIEKQHNIEVEQNRRERETQAEIERKQAETAQGQGRLDLETWKYGREDVREEGKTAAEIRRSGAQTYEAYQHGALYGTQEEGERQKNITNQNNAILDTARKAVNFANLQASNGVPIDPTWTNQLEEYGKRLSGNESFTLPRNPDGSWQYDPKTMRSMMIDEKGVPTAQYAEAMHKVEEPYNDFAKLVADFNEAKGKGADEETLKYFRDKFWTATAPTLTQVEGALVKPFVDHNDVEGAMGLISRMRSAGAPKIAIPDAQMRVKMDDTVNLIRDTDRIQEQFAQLVKSKRMPVGFLKQPWNTIRARIGTDDPDITSFLKSLDQFRAKYVYLMTGKQMGEKERIDLGNQVFNSTDSPQTFWKSMPQFRDKLVERAAISNGLAVSYGMEPAKDVPIISPGDIIGKRKIPDLVLENGYVPSSDVETHLQGMKNLGARVQAGREKVGGVEEMRNWTPSGSPGRYGKRPSAAPAAPSVGMVPRRGTTTTTRDFPSPSTTTTTGSGVIMQPSTPTSSDQQDEESGFNPDEWKDPEKAKALTDFIERSRAALEE